MRSLRAAISWLSVAVGVLWGSAIPLEGREPVRARLLRSARPFSVPLDQLPVECQRRIRPIVEQPTISYSGKPEEFAGLPALYYWLLDHPDQASRVWRRLDTPCMPITDRGDGRFGYADPQGSDIWWETVYRCPEYRVWYAEGRVKPAAWLPAVPLRAVVFFHHRHAIDESGQTVIRQQADAYGLTDSRTAALVLRMIGPSVPALSEQCIGQLGLFFSGLVRFCDRYPERTNELIYGQGPAGWWKLEEE